MEYLHLLPILFPNAGLRGKVDGDLETVSEWNWGTGQTGGTLDQAQGKAGLQTSCSLRILCPINPVSFLCLLGSPVGGPAEAQVWRVSKSSDA